jgi:hypothetical protein
MINKLYDLIKLIYCLFLFAGITEIVSLIAYFGLLTSVLAFVAAAFIPASIKQSPCSVNKPAQGLSFVSTSHKRQLH